MPFMTDAYIRRAERDDLDTVVAWMEEPDFQFFLYGDPARSPRQVREQIVRMLGRGAGHSLPGAVHLLIDSKKTGPMGLMSLQQLSWRNRSCNLDIYLSRQFRGTTVTAIAVYRALAYCFDELNLHRVGAMIYSFNRTSWRILEMTGAKRELTLEDHVPRDSEMHALYCYGLLRLEFEALKERYARHAGGLALREMAEALAAGAEQAS